MQKSKQGHVRTTPPVQNADNQGDICNLNQRPNDITALLAQKKILRTLSPRDISVYDDDPLQYEVFIRIFKRGVKSKANDQQDFLTW